MNDIIEYKVPTLEDIFDLDLKEYRDANYDKYEYNGIKVPRVTNIIKECIYKEYLIIWAARIGISKYYEEQRLSLNIGTVTHEMIENFLLYGTDLEVKNNLSVTNQRASVAYYNFKLWIEKMNSLGYNIKIIAIEKAIVCPYYGGTIDCIMSINGAIYIVDFKTSKQISYEYFIQTCAYMWAVNNGYFEGISHIDGVGIIRIDKFVKGSFEDVFLNGFIPDQKVIIDHFTLGFGSILSSYYNNINMQIQYDKYLKIYDKEYTLGGIYNNEDSSSI